MVTEIRNVTFEDEDMLTYIHGARIREEDTYEYPQILIQDIFAVLLEDIYIHGGDSIFVQYVEDVVISNVSVERAWGLRFREISRMVAEALSQLSCKGQQFAFLA